MWGGTFLDVYKQNGRYVEGVDLSQSTHVDIGNGVFAIMFENDGHSPQHCVEFPQAIKKITIKVSID